MLDEEEYRHAYKLYGEVFQDRKRGLTIQESNKKLLDYYFEVTGWQETSPNAIMHHRIAQYGPPCEQCGKPYRTPQASFCAACGHKRPVSKRVLVISFDLDDTLIPGAQAFDTEPQSWLQRLTGIEKLRKGTKDLISELRSEGHIIYIYTTSLRPVHRIRRMFLSYGIQVDKIINREVHEKELKDRQNLYSKYPPAFGIDVHIDDSEGIAREGKQHQFATIIIPENHQEWTEFVFADVKKHANIYQ